MPTERAGAQPTADTGKAVMSKRPQELPRIARSVALAEVFEVGHPDSGFEALAIFDPRLRRWSCVMAGPEGKFIARAESSSEAVLSAWKLAYGFEAPSTKELDAELETALKQDRRLAQKSFRQEQKHTQAVDPATLSLGDLGL